MSLPEYYNFQIENSSTRRKTLELSSNDWWIQPTFFNNGIDFVRWSICEFQCAWLPQLLTNSENHLKISAVNDMKVCNITECSFSYVEHPGWILFSFLFIDFSQRDQIEWASALCHGILMRVACRLTDHLSTISWWGALAGRIQNIFPKGSPLKGRIGNEFHSQDALLI